MKIKKPHITSSNKAIILIALFSVLFVLAVRWNGLSGNNFRNIIQSDGIGYYHYFEALLGENPIGKQSENGIFLIKAEDNKVVNKYFVGTALLMSPFVMPVYLVEKSLGVEIDLRSEYYQKSISIAALFYLLLGLWAIAKLLIIFKIDEHIIAFGLFALFFGTNLSYYTLIEPSMSHVYSFSLISVFFLVFKQQLGEYKSVRLIMLSALFALIVLIRPINILVVFALPFVSSSVKVFYDLILRKTKAFPINIIAVFVFILIASVQLIFWKLQTGNWIIWSYSNEGFYFLKPHLIDFLFSFRKGLFIYTPFLFLGLIVFVLAYRKHKQELFLSLGFLLLVLYVLSSWWNWYYGDSYGSRVMIDYYAIFILLFAMGIQKLRIKLQRVIVIIASLFVMLNVFQSYQYYHNIMSHFDMNASKYAYIFGKAGEKYENSLGGNDDIVRFHREPLELVYHKQYDSTMATTVDVDAKMGLYHRINAFELGGGDNYYLELSNSVLLERGNMDKVYWVIIYTDSLNKNYNYEKIKFNEIPLLEGEVEMNNYRLNLPGFMSKKDKMHLFIRNESNAKFIVLNLEIRVYTI